MQLSSATHSQPCNLPPRQAYSNGTSRPQADASEIMSRIRLSSLKPSSQVSVTRTEREAVHGEPDASHPYDLTLPPPALSPWPFELSFPHQGHPLPRLQLVDCCPRPTFTRNGLPLSFSLCWKPSPSWPSSLQPSSLFSAGFSLCSQQRKHSFTWVQPFLGDACSHTAPACSAGYCPDPRAGSRMACDQGSCLTSSFPACSSSLMPAGSSSCTHSQVSYLFICAILLAFIEYPLCVIITPDPGDTP